MTNREKYNVSKIVARRESDWHTDTYMCAWYAYDSNWTCCKQTATYEDMKEWLDEEDIVFRPTKKY